MSKEIEDSKWYPLLIEKVNFMALIPYDVLASEVARRNNAKRKVRGGGAPQVLRPCLNCGVSLGARAMRLHKPTCKAKECK